MALKRTRSGQDGTKVTFELPDTVGQTAHVCGEFNGWSTTATPLTWRRDGRFTATLRLEAGRAYRFRYLLDGERWENDCAADGYEANPYGEDDSIVRT